MTMRRTKHLAQSFRRQPVFREPGVFSVQSRSALPSGAPAPSQASQALPPPPAGRPAVHLTVSVRHSPLWEGSTGYQKQKYKPCPQAILCTSSGSATAYHDPRRLSQPL